MDRWGVQLYLVWEWYGSWFSVLSKSTTDAIPSPASEGSRSLSRRLDSHCDGWIGKQLQHPRLLRGHQPMLGGVLQGPSEG